MATPWETRGKKLRNPLEINDLSQKKVLSLVLCVAVMLSVMVLGAGAAFSDQADIENTEAVDACSALNIIGGYEDGSFHPERNIKRSEITKMICVALNAGNEPNVSTNVVPTFSDVRGTSAEWAEGYIEACVAQGIVSGVGGGRFNPDGNVTGAQLAKMLLVALGYNADTEKFTGNAITAEKLDGAIRLINEKRRALSRVFEARKNPDNIPISGTDALLVTQIAFFDDPARCAEMCNKLADELEERNRQGVSVFEKGTKRIMITGTPMAIPNWKLHHIVETSGAAVVCEEMCTGTRYFENLVEEGLPTLDEQFMALSQRYMKNNCACFTPNPGRVEDILRLAKEYHVDGVIDVNLKFCCLYDTEGYSVERALREAGIPVLGIETDYDDGDSEQLRTRIGAFVEMLG